eukprot:9473662-Pyramimonas_sp.AAC.1
MHLATTWDRLRLCAAGLHARPLKLVTPALLHPLRPIDGGHLMPPLGGRSFGLLGLLLVVCRPLLRAQVRAALLIVCLACALHLEHGVHGVLRALCRVHACRQHHAASCCGTGRPGADPSKGKRVRTPVSLSTHEKW